MRVARYWAALALESCMVRCKGTFRDLGSSREGGVMV